MKDEKKMMMTIDWAVAGVISLAMLTTALVVGLLRFLIVRVIIRPQYDKHEQIIQTDSETTPVVALPFTAKVVREYITQRLLRPMGPFAPPPPEREFPDFPGFKTPSGPAWVLRLEELVFHDTPAGPQALAMVVNAATGQRSILLSANEPEFSQWREFPLLTPIHPSINEWLATAVDWISVGDDPTEPMPAPEEG